MKHLSFILILFIMIGCSEKQMVDAIYYNANVYTVDLAFSVKQAFAIKNGKISAVGSDQEIQSLFESKNTVNLKGKYVYPGFIDAHCHFYYYGLNLQWADLTGTKSFDEVVERVKIHYQNNPDAWILGRGWDQNDWEDKNFPDNTKLNELFVDIPVYLVRIDGHAAIVNNKALELAKYTIDTEIEGGSLLKENKILTGVLIDNAKDSLYRLIPKSTREQEIAALLQAAKNCHKVGLTSIVDAGLRKNTINLIDSLQNEKLLKMRIYAMIESSDSQSYGMIQEGPYKTDFLNVRSIKMYADGALGSRGALMLRSYSDDYGNKGLMVNPISFYDSICDLAYEKGFQVNTHAIGDAAVRFVLKTYAKYLKEKNDLRWRIEHSQVVHPDDFHLFGDYNIIPSIQTTHATSDMYWAKKRLGPYRIKGAYAYKQLLDQNEWIPNGSDFPIESINPLLGFYAGVSRKDVSGFPPKGFQKENALTREDALKAMTIWAAKSCFEEDEKGSIEPKKWADFVILNENLLEIDESEIPNIKVLQTFIGGECVFLKE